MIVCQFQLTDVNEGDGGLCVVPGSHKANLPPTEEIRRWEQDQQVVYNVPCKAGDLVIFNEATLHGTLPWTAEHERRSLLYRYSPRTVHFAGGTYQTTQPEWVSELTEAQQAVLEPPYIYNRPLINDDGSIEAPRR
jgi:ectoine hydroxylase-related dioxygenase (phytanoyl-CoA dioxygenase family)